MSCPFYWTYSLCCFCFDHNIFPIHSWTTHKQDSFFVFLYRDMINRKKWWLIYWLAYSQQYKAHRQYLFCNIVDFMLYIKILIHSLLSQENCTAQISTWISPTEKYIPVIFPVCDLDFIPVKIIQASLLEMAYVPWVTVFFFISLFPICMEWYILNPLLNPSVIRDQLYLGD